jgi:hypothetical protein
MTVFTPIIGEADLKKTASDLHSASDDTDERHQDDRLESGRHFIRFLREPVQKFL